MTNSNDSLTGDDLPHLLELLWRKDPARSEGSHSGQGLVLTEAFARILGMDIQFGIIKIGRVSPDYGNSPFHPRKELKEQRSIGNEDQLSTK